MKCCERDYNDDGNCDKHSAPGVDRPYRCSRMRQLDGEPLDYMPLRTPPDLAGKMVTKKKNGVVSDRRPYDPNYHHICQCGVVYSEIDALGDHRFRHTNIRTGEVTECSLTLEPMEAPSGLFHFWDYTYEAEEK